MNQHRPWSEEALATLRRLHAQNLSSHEIVAEMQRYGYSFTKNAIIGKVHRLKLVNSTWPGTGAYGPRLKLRLKNLRRKAALKFHAKHGRVAKVEENPKPADKPAEKPVILALVERRKREPKETPGTLLIDLEYGQCRWPINSPPRGEPFLFCDDDAIPQHPYCPAHSRIAYNNPRKAYA